MSIFSGAMNGIRSTVSRAGKYYNSTQALKGRAVAGYMARSAKVKPMSMAPIGAAAAIGGVGGAVVGGRDHRGRDASIGAAGLGAGMAGYGASNVWKNMTPAIRGLLK